MDQETSRIKSHIDSEREQLDVDLDEFEERIRSATDLGKYFRRNPWLWAGAALGVGVLIGSAIRAGAGAKTSRADFPRTSGRLQEGQAVLDNILSAFIGLGSKALAEALADAVPGFGTELEQARRRRESDSARGEAQPDNPPLAAAS